MKRDLIIGIDAGTSLIKAVAFTLDGVQLAVTSRPNQYARPAPGFAEQDMWRTWQDTAATLRDLAQLVPGLSARTAALAVTAQGDGTWLVDADGEPVGGGLLWLDSRAAKIAADFVRSPAHAAQYASTGTGVNACQQAVQIAWFHQHQPDMLARATSAMHCKDWLYLQLTGVRAADPSESVFTYGDFRTRSYSRPVLERLGIGEYERLLPPIVDGLYQHHRLSPAGAAQTGLPQGLPVVLAYVDIICSVLGGGLYDASGQVGCSVLGSTGVHVRMAAGNAAVHLNPECSGYTIALPRQNYHAQMQSNMAATLNIDWMAGLASQAGALAGTGTSQNEIMARIEPEIAMAAPGQALFHPYILEAGERGPFMNAHARAQFTGLSSTVTFAGMFRAAYEGLAFAARDCYGAMGALPGEIRLTGGAARSATLRKILASALNVPVRTVKREETGAAGAAMIAALCLGIYPDLDACTQAWVEPLLGSATQPEDGLARLYERLFPVYYSVREAMVPAWDQLARVREGAA